MALKSPALVLSGMGAYLLLSPLAGLAAEAAPGQQAPDLFSAGLKMFSSLILIMAVMMLCLYLLKKLSISRNGLASPHSLIRVTATRRLDSRHFITIVEVGETILTLGVTPENIICLDKTERGQFPRSQPAVYPDPGEYTFTARLKSLLGQKAAPAEEAGRP